MDEVATFCGQEPQNIAAAIEHEWFKVSANHVMIAYDGTRKWRQSVYLD
jgi:hypothetical protein